jgi:hypothetical protein
MSEGLFFDFDAFAPSDDDKATLPPTCTFKMGGKQWTVRNKDLVPFDAMYAITAATDLGAPLAIGPFFAGVLEPGEVQDFMQTLASPNVTLPMATEAAKFVLSALHGRPTKPSASSPAGRKPTGRKSAGGSSSQATAKRASAS